MAANYYGAQQTKMADYGYGDDDPYSFGGYSATQPPMSSGDRPVDNETQRKRSPTTGGFMPICVEPPAEFFFNYGWLSNIFGRYSAQPDLRGQEKMWLNHGWLHNLQLKYG